MIVLVLNIVVINLTPDALMTGVRHGRGALRPARGDNLLLQRCGECRAGERR